MVYLNLIKKASFTFLQFFVKTFFKNYYVIIFYFWLSIIIELFITIQKKRTCLFLTVIPILMKHIIKLIMQHILHSYEKIVRRNINYVGMSIFQQNRLFRRYNSWTVQSILLIHTNSICISTVSVACQIISSSFETFKNDHFSRKVIQYIIICRYIHRYM